MKIAISAASVAMLIFLLFSASMNAHAWEQDSGWGYKWSGNIGKGNFNESFSGEVEGKWVIAIYVEYSGEERGRVNLSYFGSIYSYSSVHGGEEHSGEKVYWDIENRMLWFNFDGFIIMNRSEIKNLQGKVYPAYVVEYQMIHVYTKKPLDLNFKIRRVVSEGNYNISMGYQRSVRGNYELKAWVNYYNPLAYIPLDNFTANPYTEVHYRAIEKEDLMVNISTFGMWKNQTVKGTYRSNGSFVMPYALSRSGSQVFRPGIIENIPALLLRTLSMSTNLNSSVGDFIKGILWPNLAHYNGDFYTQIQLQLPIFETLVKQNSTEVSKSEVKEIMNNAPEMYGPKESNWITWLIVASLAVPVAIILILLVLRKRRGKYLNR